MGQIMGKLWGNYGKMMGPGNDGKMMGQWWGNDWKMLGKRLENDGKIMGKWYIVPIFRHSHVASCCQWFRMNDPGNLLVLTDDPEKHWETVRLVTNCYWPMRYTDPDPRKPLQYLRRSIPQLYLYYRESPRKIVCLPGMRFHHQHEKTYDETRELRQFTRICPCGKRYCCIPMDFGWVLSPIFRQTQLLCPTISSIPSTSIRPLPFQKICGSVLHLSFLYIQFLCRCLDMWGQVPRIASKSDQKTFKTGVSMLKPWFPVDAPICSHVLPWTNVVSSRCHTFFLLIFIDTLWSGMRVSAGSWREYSKSIKIRMNNEIL
jgi:hypothetical protein